MDADAFGGAMIHRDEHRSQPLTRERGRQISSPHGVDRLGDDGAIVAAWAARRTHASWCQQVILAHQLEHPAQRRAIPAHRNRAQTLRCPSPGRDWRRARLGALSSNLHRTSAPLVRAALAAYRASAPDGDTPRNERAARRDKPPPSHTTSRTKRRQSSPAFDAARPVRRLSVFRSDRAGWRRGEDRRAIGLDAAPPFRHAGAGSPAQYNLP